MKKIIFLLLLTVFLVGCQQQTPVGPNGNFVDVEVKAYNWGFEYDPIVVKKGDTVRMKVTSESGKHSVAIPALVAVGEPVSPGEEDVLEFVASKSGEFAFYCATSCGSGHGKMRGTIVVEE